MIPYDTWNNTPIGRIQEAQNWTNAAQDRAARLKNMMQSSINSLRSKFNGLMGMKELTPGYLASAVNDFRRATGSNKTSSANSSTPYDVDDLIAKSNKVEEAFYGPQAELLGAFQNQYGGSTAYPGASGGLRPVGAVGYAAGAAINAARTGNKHSVFDALLNAQQQANALAQQNYTPVPQLDPNSLIQAASGYRNQMAQVMGQWGDRLLGGISGVYQNAPWPETMAGPGGVSQVIGNPNGHAGSYYAADQFTQTPDSFTNKIQEQNLINQRNQTYNDQMQRQQQTQMNQQQQQAQPQSKPNMQGFTS